MKRQDPMLVVMIDDDASIAKTVPWLIGVHHSVKVVVFSDLQSALDQDGLESVRILIVDGAINGYLWSDMISQMRARHCTVSAVVVFSGTHSYEGSVARFAAEEAQRSGLWIRFVRKTDTRGLIAAVAEAMRHASSAKSSS